MTVATTSDTRTRVLDVSQGLVQTRGFNGVSYADIADELGITKAALHYHFPTKAELGLAVVERYIADFDAALSGIDASGGTASDRLATYAALYLAVLRGERLCLCAMLATEQETLPPPMRDAVVGFFARNVDWLTGALRLGGRDGTLTVPGSPRGGAEMILGTLEGGMLVAWSRRDPAGFRRTVRQLFASLAPAR